MKIAVTGAYGFLGWHSRCALKAENHQIVAIGRELLGDCAALAHALSDVNGIMHVAGVNRADYDSVFTDNVAIARELTAALDRAGVRAPVVYANSIQSGSASVFGRTKEAAAEHLLEWGRVAGAPVADVRLPNLFGEHGRPNYNSVVATFCDTLARGQEPRIEVDKELPLLHVQDAVDTLLDLVEHPANGLFEPQGRPMTVSALLDKLREFRDLYRTGEIPDVVDRFDRALFNTFRSFCFPDWYPIRPALRKDERGSLFESVRSHGGPSQAFSSRTNPGATRGNHFHRRKVERFVVLHGAAVISLRRLFTDDVVRFEVAGDQPQLVDMPTMWTHSITNAGAAELTTLFWADEVFNPQRPDTFPEPVEPEPAVA